MEALQEDGLVTGQPSQQQQRLVEAQIPDNQEIDFVTLGMLIIDDIHFPAPRPPCLNVLGGAGTFSALGARIFSPSTTPQPQEEDGPGDYDDEDDVQQQQQQQQQQEPLSRRVGWIVDRGSDFPADLTSLIHSWSTSALIRDDPGRLTTRGWNGYDDPLDPGRRAFRYMTPKLRLQPSDLESCRPLLRARAFHVISSPSRCREVVAALRSARKRAMGGEDEDGGDAYVRPIVVWEPVPDRCTPEELLECTNTLPVVDVCSPNHAELAGLMGDTGPGAGLDAKGEVDRQAVERACEQLLASMPLQSFAIVVRAGAEGCYVARNGGRKKRSGGGGGWKKKKKKQQQQQPRDLHGGLQPDTDMEALFAGLVQGDDGAVADQEIEVDPGVERWLPAFFGPTEAHRVVDPTGGGNTFLGGLAVAMARGRPVEEAAAWGSVAASLAIEQVGLPVLRVGADGVETWNGTRVEERLESYLARLN